MEHDDISQNEVVFWSYYHTLGKSQEGNGQYGPQGESAL